MHNKKTLKAKLKSYNGKIITNFRSNELTRESSESICLSVILIDSVFKSGRNYYRQLLFEESKFGIKKKEKDVFILPMNQKFLQILMKKICRKKN